MTEKLKFTSMVTGEVVEFESYITDMGQTFASTWNSEEVFGRNDPIATFQGTKRTISLSFEVPAKDKGEAKINLANCAKLATFLYPGYSGDFEEQKGESFEPKESQQVMVITQERSTSRSLQRPPLVKIKFGNLINSMGSSNDGLLGFIDNYSFTPNMEAGIFGVSKSLYPRTISISLSFTVLHQSDLGHASNVISVDEDFLGEAKKLLEKGEITQAKFNEYKKANKENKEIIEHKWLGKKLPFM